MAFFDWDAKLSTGIQIIDEQHKKLISFVNELHEAMRNRKGRETVGRILGELKKYTDYHFSTEERAFETYGYPQAAAHRKSHTDLIGRLDELIAKQARDELAVSVSTLDFLINWVKNHIMKEDMLYAPFLKDKPIRA